MNRREANAAVFLIVFLLLLCTFLVRMPAPLTVPPVQESAGTALWIDRTFEVLLQGLIILAGAISIILLLVAGNKPEDVP